MKKTVLLEKKGTILKITMNRPDAFNALDTTMGEELVRAVEEGFDPSIRAVVLTGAGRSFCSGGDLKAMQDIGVEKLPDFLRDLTKLLHRMITDIRLLPKPVIAAINGSLGGAGMSIALACDLRYAVDGTRFKIAYTSVGLIPDGGMTAFLPAIVGYSKSSELLLLDPVFDAAKAKEMGIVHDVFSKEEFTGKVNELAETLAKGATLSFARSKELLNASLLPGLEKQLERERQGIIAVGKTQDAKEGIDAFFGKRHPDFLGK